MSFLRTIERMEHRYSRLPSEGHIRLLVLSPEGTGTPMIRASLGIFPLSAIKNSVAVSYTWGDLKTTKLIAINGCDFEVRENIWEFLFQARQSKTLHSKPFWIDSICINQANEDEKDAQIQLMGTIYEKAQHVLIWLGIAADESNILLRCLDFVQRTKDPKFARSHDVGRRLAARFTRHVEKKKRSRQRSDDESAEEDMSEALDYSLAKELGPWIEERKEALIHALICLFGRPYWQRVWIVQECLLAKKSHLFVCCGSQMISWTALERIRRESSTYYGSMQP
jgi:hypothetical protein